MEIQEELWLGEATARRIGKKVLKVVKFSADGQSVELRFGPEVVSISVGDKKSFEELGDLTLLEVELRERPPGTDGGGNRARFRLERPT